MSQTVGNWWKTSCILQHKFPHWLNLYSGGQQLCTSLLQIHFLLCMYTYCCVDSLLIMLTSLAPSPTARVTAFLCFLMSSTTWAFCSGVTLQQITALHTHAVHKNSVSMSGSKAWACWKVKKNENDRWAIKERNGKAVKNSICHAVYVWIWVMPFIPDCDRWLRGQTLLRCSPGGGRGEWDGGKQGDLAAVSLFLLL